MAKVKAAVGTVPPPGLRRCKGGAEGGAGGEGDVRGKRMNAPAFMKPAVSAAARRSPGCHGLTLVHFSACRALFVGYVGRVG